MERVASPFFTETRCTETGGAGLGVASAVEWLQPQRALRTARAKTSSAYRSCRRSADILVRSRLQTLDAPDCVKGHIPFGCGCGQGCPRSGSWEARGGRDSRIVELVYRLDRKSVGVGKECR